MAEMCTVWCRRGETSEKDESDGVAEGESKGGTREKEISNEYDCPFN